MYRKKYLMYAATFSMAAICAGCATVAPQGASAETKPTSAKFVVIDEEDNRIWVFQDGSEELAAFEKHGELAKHVVRPRAGHNGETIKAPDAETIDAYLASAESKAPRFVTIDEDGRLWVFHAGSEELAAFRHHGELAKHVVRPRSGPNGETIKAPDGETIDAYLASL